MSHDTKKYFSHFLFYFFFWTCPNNSLYKNWRLFTIQFLLSLWLFVIWWPWPEMLAMSLWWSHVMGDPGWQFANTAEKSKSQGIWISFLVKLKSAQFLQLAQNARFLSQINLCCHNQEIIKAWKLCSEIWVELFSDRDPDFIWLQINLCCHNQEII